MKQSFVTKWIAAGMAACMLLGSMVQGGLSTEAADTAEKPMLTIACLSDLHNQESLIEGDVEDVKLRGVVDATLKAIKEEEEIDMMILCGDYTSDSTDIPQENWLKIREIIAESTRNAFPDDAVEHPVLWVNGNHEYEITREYNAGDYYTYPMKDDVGELPPEDCFYESTYDGKYDLLAAYYYELYGFDFLCLNTGNFIYEYPDGSGDYTGYEYSLESVQWIKQKLDEIYEENKDKTVFFIMHMPFDDSNSINRGKGLDESAQSTILLKKTLAEHPNLITLYGHDHGKDSAYIRTDTAQRVTQYDINGKKIGVPDYTPLWTFTPTEGGYLIQNAKKNEYLGYCNSNLQLSETEQQVCRIEKGDGGKWKILLPTTERPYVYFSTSSKTFSANKAECQLGIYELTGEENGVKHFEVAQEIKKDAVYAVAQQAGDAFYMMTNEQNGLTGIDLRFIPTPAEASGSGFDYEENKHAAESFITCFVGSMRYYISSIDGRSSPEDSKVVQALMVYVYDDRVELQMKNYGAYGYYDQPYPENPSIVISKNLKPYISYRKVINKYANTRELSDLVKEMERVSVKGYSAGSVQEFMK